MSEAIEVGFLIGSIAWLLIAAVIFVAALEGLSYLGRKSKRYRQTLADMYVSSKIKQLAKNEGLDLGEEFESFKKYVKKQNLSEKSLDNAIESELKEKLAEELPKETKTKE